MKIHDRDIRPIPRQAISGFMCLGVVEDSGKFYVIQLEPQEPTASDPRPFIRIVEFKKMQRSDNLLDGDTEERITPEERESILQFAVDRELLTDKRVEIAIRKAAALSLKGTPPHFYHQYPCLMYKEKIAMWDAGGRKGTAPQQMVSTYDCWRCPKNYRDPCIFKLTQYQEETEPDRYIADVESAPKL